MKFLGSNEFRLFITFLIIYSLFVHWVGWNEQTRLLSAISLVDEGRLDINDYANYTGDRVFFNGNYYSDKPPGSSLFLAPIYSLAKVITNDKYNPSDANKILLPEPQFNTTVYTDKNTGNAVLLTSLLGTVLLSSLPGAILVVLIYKTALEMGRNKKTALITSVVFGLGTIIFSYSTVFMGNILSLLFLFLSFYIVYIKKSGGKSHLLVSGIFLGLSISIDYLATVFSVLFIAMIFLRRLKAVPFLAIGLLIGVMPLAIYNSMIFGNPLVFYESHLDPKISPCSFGTQYLSTCPTNSGLSVKTIQLMFLGIEELLFMPYRGLLFYMPFLMFSFVGLFYLYKKNKDLSLLVLFTFIAYLILNSLYVYWFGGSTFGPKYLLGPIPFLSVPFLAFIKGDKRPLISIIFWIIVIVSIFQMFLSTTGFWEGATVYALKNSNLIRLEWYKQGVFWVDSFRNLNPLYNHYLPALISDGPRSRILEQAIASRLPDIRDLSPISVRELTLFTTPYGILILRVPFLVLLMFPLIMLAVWYKRIARNKPVIYVLIILALVLLLSEINLSSITFDNNWYPLTYNDSLRFMSNNATLSIFSESGKNGLLNLSIGTFHKPRVLLLTLNNESLGYFVVNSFNDSVMVPVNLTKGSNIIGFSSIGGCDYPIRLNYSIDWRCLSFAVKNISIEDGVSVFKGNNSLLFTNNWQVTLYKKEDIAWAYNNTNATILTYSWMPLEYRISMDITSYHDYRKVYVYLNNQLVDEINVSPFLTKYMSRYFSFNEGENEVKLFSDGCISPRTIENSSDARCLSYGITNFTLVHVNFTDGYFFTNSYQPESNGTLRWLTDGSGIAILSSRPKAILLNATYSSYYRPRYLSIFLNGYESSKYFIDNRHDTETSYLVILAQNETYLTFDTKPPCDKPSQVEFSTDKRCFSVILKDFELFNASGYLDGLNEGFENGWYDLEHGQQYTFRWFSNNATIHLFNPRNENVNINLSFVSWSYHRNRTANIILDNAQLAAFNLTANTGNSYEFDVEIKPGNNVITFDVPSGCEIPFLLENSNDKRCLSMAVADLEISIVS